MKDSFNDLRVRLTGRIQEIGDGIYVLIAPDLKALLVRFSAGSGTWEYEEGANVDITGVLRFSKNNLPYLFVDNAASVINK